MKDFQLWQLEIFLKVTRQFTFFFFFLFLKIQYLGYGFSITIGGVKYTFNEASRAPPEGIATAAYSPYVI